jgi:hypothetical protein
MAGNPLRKAADSLVDIAKDKRAASLSGGPVTPALRRAAESLVQIEKDKRAAALKSPRKTPRS